MVRDGSFQSKVVAIFLFGKLPRLCDGSQIKNICEYLRSKLPLKGRVPAIKEKQIYGCSPSVIKLAGVRDGSRWKIAVVVGCNKKLCVICELKFPVADV